MTSDILTPEQRKTFEAAFDKRCSYAQIDAVFKDQDRLYLECQGTASDTLTRDAVADALIQHGYQISDYLNGLARKDGSKQDIRIGKLLQQIAPELMSQYAKDPCRSADKVMVVISRNRDDIIRMSAGRKWRSCMSPGNEEFNDFAHKDIEHGTLIAYLTSTSDHDIERPLARILIKPYVSAIKPVSFDPATPVSAKSSFSRLFTWLSKSPRGETLTVPEKLSGPDVVFIPEQRAYGTMGDLLKRVVDTFTAKLNRDAPDGSYILPRDMYCDSGTREVAFYTGQPRRVMGYPVSNSVRPVQPRASQPQNK